MTTYFVNGKQVAFEELSQYTITNERIIRILLEAGEREGEKERMKISGAEASEGT